MATAGALPSNELVLEGISAVTDEISGEGEKTHNTKLLSQLTRTVKSVSSLSTAWNNVRLTEKLNDYVSKVETKVTKMIENSELKGTDLVAKTKKFHEMFGEELLPDLKIDLKLDPDDAMVDVKDVGQQIVQTFKDQHRKQRDHMFELLFVDKCITAGIQFWKMYSVWKKISAAADIVADDTKFTLMRRNLKRMDTVVTELEKMCETNPKDERINGKTRTTRYLKEEILKLNDKVTGKIESQINTIDSAADIVAFDAIATFISALTQGIQLWNSFDDLSSTAKVYGGFSIGLFGLIGVFQFSICFKSRQQLHELREDLKKAKELNQQLDELKVRSEAARDDLLADN